ncbi:MAG: S9 family peptidase [Planctomycetota bacterium]
MRFCYYEASSVHESFSEVPARRDGKSRQEEINMSKQQGIMSVFLVAGIVVMSSPVRAQEPEQSEKEAMYYRYLEFPSYVKGGSIKPHWMADGSSFWYAEGDPNNTIIYKVNPEANTKTPLFDTARLRQALTVLLGFEPPYQGLPFDEFTFVEGEKAVKFTVEDKEFILHLDTYTITRVPALYEEEKSRLAPQVARKGTIMIPDLWEVLSPDRRWFAGLKDHNLWLRSATDDRSVQITTDGIKDYEWGFLQAEEAGPWAEWSPDSSKLAVKKVDSRKVAPIPIVHWLKPTVEVEWIPYPFAHEGGPLRQSELFVVDILSKRQVRVDTGKEPDQYIHIVGWRPDGSELLFLRMNREFKKLELMAANPSTGSTRLVLTEIQKTFIGGEAFSYEWPWLFTLLADGNRFIWMSERDSWNHLYLYDLDGTLIRQLTRGTFPVVRVVATDEKAGWVYFSARADRRRPCDTHFYRVSLQGEGFMRLTKATGSHRIHFAPSKAFFLDSHSYLDRARRVELRRADGTPLQTLTQANIDTLKELKWKAPEEFMVKAADGETDLHGVLYKPCDFDPGKKYPVIEHIYAGPQMRLVPHYFIYRSAVGAQALAQLGFVTFIVDGRGTPGRGKEFQDVVYGNFGRHEIPDHVAVLKQLAATRPYMDLSRVGIYGHSWGGYFTIRAMLLAPDVYHVGIASAGSAKPIGTTPVEPYLGLPQDNKEAYEYASNLRLAGNLKGKLLLLIGTSDPLFEQNMKMVEAFIRAGKPYDLNVFPEQGHGFIRQLGSSSRHYWETLRRYFQEHLKP